MLLGRDVVKLLARLRIIGFVFRIIQRAYLERGSHKYNNKKVCKQGNRVGYLCLIPSIYLLILLFHWQINQTLSWSYLLMQFPRRRPEQMRMRRGTGRKPCTTTIIQVFSSHPKALDKTVTKFLYKAYHGMYCIYLLCLLCYCRQWECVQTLQIKLNRDKLNTVRRLYIVHSV
jgi:hypothetical protein